MNLSDYLIVIIPLLTGVYTYLLSTGLIHKNSLKTSNLRNRYGRFLKFFSFLLIVAGLFGIYSITTQNIPSPDLKIRMDEASMSLNKDLPRMIDRETELVEVKVNDSELVYKYRFINTKKGEMDMSVFTNGIFMIQRFNFCSDKFSSELISKGASIKAVYYTMDNEEITSLTIDKKICN